MEVLKRIFQSRNFIQKFSSRVYCTFKEPRHKMAGGHVFCAPRNLCVFLFTYLSFTTLLNVDCSWSIFSTPGKILYTSQQLSMPTIPSEGASKLKSAGSSRSRHNLVKVHLGLTLMLNSTYAMMMICLSNDVSLNPGPTVTQSTNLPTIRGFKISHLNVRSITHKMDSIRLLLKDNTLDVFTVSETWLSPKVTDAEITIPGYSVVGKDRNSRGGGVAMFIRDGIPFKTRMDITDSSISFKTECAIK